MTITRDQLSNLVVDELGPLADVSGSVLGVTVSTIRPGRFYLMGLNPGGDPQKHGESILESLQAVEHEPGWCSHTHDCWKCDERPVCQHLASDRRVLAAHLKPHQQRVQQIYGALGVSPGEVVATNAVFARSSGEDTLHGVGNLGAWGWWERCWPVHQRMLEEVRPEWIVTLGKGFGTSAFGFLMHKAGVGRRDVQPLGNDGYDDGRMFVGRLALKGRTLSVRVLGLPHPSYYGINDTLRTAIRARLNEGSAAM